MLASQRPYPPPIILLLRSEALKTAGPERRSCTFKLWEMSRALTCVFRRLSPNPLALMRACNLSNRYSSIEPDPDNPRQSYLDYMETFPLNAEPEVWSTDEIKYSSSSDHQVNRRWRLATSTWVSPSASFLHRLSSFTGSVTFTSSFWHRSLNSCKHHPGRRSLLQPWRAILSAQNADHASRAKFLSRKQKSSFKFSTKLYRKVFGMHENASITCAIAETEMSFSIVLSMQPRTGGGGGASREDLIGGIAKNMEERSGMHPRFPWHAFYSVGTSETVGKRFHRGFPFSLDSFGALFRHYSSLFREVSNAYPRRCLLTLSRKFGNFERRPCFG